MSKGRSVVVVAGLATGSLVVIWVWRWRRRPVPTNLPPTGTHALVEDVRVKAAQHLQASLTKVVVMLITLGVVTVGALVFAARRHVGTGHIKLYLIAVLANASLHALGLPRAAGWIGLSCVVTT